MTTYPILELALHSNKLSELLNNLCRSNTTFRSITTKANESLNWSHAAALLKLASSVIGVNLDTARFDDSVAWCSSASDYHFAHSELLAELVRELSVFNFIWGAFETVTKIINPPNIPKNNSIIDAACNYLTRNFDPLPRVEHYDEAVFDLRNILRLDKKYGVKERDFRFDNHIGVSSIGIHIVRRIRNKFAHGTLDIPEPDGWTGGKPLDASLFDISSRIALLTIQMLIITHFNSSTTRVHWYRDRDWYEDDDHYLEIEDPFIDIGLEYLLRIIHMQYQPPSRFQRTMPLFGMDTAWIPDVI